jgi:ubiquinone/menaquinone biosynthesis C-methylase UbiE
VIGIPRPDRWFDYVRHRFLVGAIPANKWKQYIQECMRVCSSDGWIEIIESDGRLLNGGPACEQFNAWTSGGFEARGIDRDKMHTLDELMKEEGLINVTKQTFTIPLGSRGGRAGELFAEDYRLLSSSFQPFITKLFNVSKEEVEKNCALMVEEFKSYQVNIVIYVYLGQKK